MWSEWYLNDSAGSAGLAIVLWLREVIGADMPTYEYLCQACGSRFEAWQKITDDPIEICPTCGDHVHRVLYPVGLVFKGSGFYKNDSRATAGSTSKSASSDGGSSDSTKSEGTKSEGTKSDTAAPAAKSAASTTSTPAAKSA